MEFLGAIVFVFIIVAVLINGNVFTSLRGKMNWKKYEKEYREKVTPVLRELGRTEEQINTHISEYVAEHRQQYNRNMNIKK